jgi:signal peptidase I
MTAETAAVEHATTHTQAGPERGQSPRRHHQGRRRRVSVSTALTVLLGLLVALVAVAVLSGGWQIRPVLSGSMRPGLAVGGVAVTQRVPLSDIKVRDAIVFHKPTDPAKLVMHRVIKLEHTGSTYTVKTQGDANTVPDAWTLQLKGDTAYRVRFSLPLLGYPAVWMQDAGRMNLLTLGVGLMILLGVVGMWRKDRDGSSEPDPGRADDLDSDDPRRTTTPEPTIS